jgi:hypothetical protein
MVWYVNSNQTNKHASKPFAIGTSSILPGCKSDTAAIQTIRIYNITSQLITHHHMQIEEHSNSTVTPFENKNISASKWMQITATTIVGF